MLDLMYIYGRSWGSTLACMYAIEHPESVKAMFVGGIYLASTAENQQEVEHAHSFFPELWEVFVNETPVAGKDDPLQYHLQTILGDDAEAAKRSAFTYSKFTLGFMRLDDRQRQLDYDGFEWNNFIIDAHYKLNNCFIPDGFIMQHAAKLTMPVHIVQGRYDIGCPPKTAYELHQKLPNSQLYWTIAGHSNSDRSNFDMSRALLNLARAN